VRVSVFSNIPNHYNPHLFSELRCRGHRVTVLYDHTAQEAGRPWSVEMQTCESVVHSPVEQFRAALRADREDDAVVFSGSYIGWAALGRRLALTGRHDQRLFWGERLSSRKDIALARRIYLRPFGAVLAVGSWAQAGYQAAVPGSVPVHVLPYVTAVPSGDRMMSPEPTIGFAGSLIPRKGVELVLRALGSMPPSRRPLFEIAGSGPWRAQLEESASSLRVSPIWLGELSPDELAMTRRRWWVQVVPSLYDGWGVVVSEALAAGVPVLASAATGAAIDLIKDDFNGRILKDDKAWVDAIGAYCDADRVVREGANGRMIGEEMAAGKAAQWLEELLAESSRQSRSFVAEAWVHVNERRGSW
jgi:glycosyltransferase involved in cell wall biosynthesis